MKTPQVTFNLVEHPNQKLCKTLRVGAQGNLLKSPGARLAQGSTVAARTGFSENYAATTLGCGARGYHAVTDVEIIGETFLIVTHNLETGQTRHYWETDRDKFIKLYQHPSLTFVGFNSNTFDTPLIEALVQGRNGAEIKRIANAIIQKKLTPWQTYREFNIAQPTADWIDIKEPTPGVMLSLKDYEGRMHYPNLQDMPTDHDADISNDAGAKQLVLDYCINDVMATAALFETVRDEITLRAQMSSAYGIDLRSKSGPQAAEAILCRVCDIPRRKTFIPYSVGYTAPDFIKTESPVLQQLIEQIENHDFKINQTNGSVEFPAFLRDPIKINQGAYQLGIGGLHSKHDAKVHYEATKGMLISDFDVASYYPSLLIAAQLVPNLKGGKGEEFLETYKQLFDDRIEAKRTGDKASANSYKLLLNGVFGKLGNQYCAFYSPNLMLAITLTGQLNLLIKIDLLERIEGVRVVSANTDGITVTYPPAARDEIAAVLAASDTFAWEETPYREIAYRDVNSYIAVTTDGKIKRKGAFGESGVMPPAMGNPFFDICADAAAAYLADRTPVEETVLNCGDIRKFVAVRKVNGGGVQHLNVRMVDDWKLVKDAGSAQNEWYSKTSGKTVKRKSRPRSYELAEGGKPFGRVARWYRSTEALLPLAYVGSGKRVPDTEQACLCLELPEEMPSSVDKAWYINRAKDMLIGAGVELDACSMEIKTGSSK